MARNRRVVKGEGQMVKNYGLASVDEMLEKAYVILKGYYWHHDDEDVFDWLNEYYAMRRREKYEAPDD